MSDVLILALINRIGPRSKWYWLRRAVEACAAAAATGEPQVVDGTFRWTDRVTIAFNIALKRRD